MSKSVEERLEESREEGRDKGLVIGIRDGEVEGLTLGQEQERLETAVQMLCRSVERKQIAKWTGLPLEYVEYLSKSIEKNRKRADREAVSDMLEKKEYDLAEISALLELPLEEVEQLRSKLEQ